MFPLPNNIQVGLVQGCNRKCKFCGIHSIGTKPIHRMSLLMVQQIARSLRDWEGFDKKRVEFALHGEPTLHHNVEHVMSVFREHLPKAQLQLTTNGLKLLDKGAEYVEALFTVGLNVLIVDTYSKRDRLIHLLKNALESILKSLMPYLSDR